MAGIAWNSLFKMMTCTVTTLVITASTEDGKTKTKCKLIALMFMDALI